MMNKNIKISVILIIFSLLSINTINILKKNFVVADDLELNEQEASVRSIKKVLPSVVNIVVYDEEELAVLNLGTGKSEVQRTERKKVGSGTGFIITPDGLILTNKHVINSGAENADYRVILTNGKKYYAQMIGKDPVNDLGVLKIFDKNLPTVELGDSGNLPLGTTVIAIGNALGIYQNTVTKGIVSGLGRDIVASNGFKLEQLTNVIQTDAQINLGNSGGPLIDLHGRVVGINVAVDNEGRAIGFAIPINDAKPVIESVVERGRIVRPQIGVRYKMIIPEMVEELGLTREEGALLVKGDDGIASVIADSPAAKAGLKEGDIIFEINAIKINQETPLIEVVQRFKPGNRIGLKIQRGTKVIIITLTLGEFK